MVRVLGPIELGEAARRVRGRQAALVTLLALAAPRSVPTQVLLSAVFEDRSDATAGELRVLVSRLRGLLRDACPGGGIEHAHGGYALVGVQTDAASFEQLYERAMAAASSEPSSAARDAGEALQLWRDEAGHHAVGGHPAMVRLTELRMATLVLRFRSLAACGDEAEWLGELLAQCRTHPYVEELWALAMTALYRSGRQAEALLLYQEARTRLVEELGIEPGPLLRRAEAAVLQQNVEAPAQQAMASKGRFRHYTDRYVDGGAKALLAAALEHGRLISVVGTAGIGKTRLVSEILPELSARRWRDGTLFCSLSELSSSAQVGPSVALAAGVRVPPGARAEDVLAAEWNAGERLLVLDTCEHVVEGVAAVASALLRGCAGVTIVATSRAPTRVPGEYVLAMPALDPETAVELFLDRAWRAHPAFAPGEADRVAIGRLCAGLDALPLAIELAATRVRAFSPQELLDRLDRRFAFLRAVPSHAPPDGHDRHASLDAALEWSYRGLSPVHQQAFRLLGIFSSDIDLSAFEALASEQLIDPAAVLADLVDRSVVVATPHRGGTRYGMLDSVRAYARSLLDGTAERDVAAACHARLVCSRKNAAVMLARGPREAEAVESLDRLWPELRSAVSWALERRDVVQLFELVAGLGETAMLRERAEVGDWVDAALEYFERPRASAVSDELEAAVLAAGAMSDWWTARFDRGVERAGAAFELWEKHPIGDCVPILQATALQRGVRRPEAFVGLCTQLAEQAGRMGDRTAQSWLLSGAAMGHAYFGRPTQALAVCDDAELLARLAGNPSRLGMSLFARTIALVDIDPESAIATADRTAGVAGAVNTTWLISNVSNYRSAALLAAGRLDEARADTLAILRRLRAGGSHQSATNTLRNTVSLLGHDGAYRNAALLIGWLRVGRGVPGTPGMRQRVEEVGAYLPQVLSEPERLLERGATLALDEVVELAISALGGG